MKIDRMVNFRDGVMKREEKNQQTRRRIVDGALAEFAKCGYGASSINNICAAQGISKGIIYHYFKTKDDLYLNCVGECFALLTQHIQSCLVTEQESVEKQLERYFHVRMAFFRDFPVYQPIFCEAVVSPPAHLEAGILESKRAFDELNVEILERLLRQLPLRPPTTMASVVETFRQFQDFINAKYQMAGMSSQEFEMREESCRKALNILLYGVIERK